MKLKLVNVIFVLSALVLFLATGLRADTLVLSTLTFPCANGHGVELNSGRSASQVGCTTLVSAKGSEFADASVVVGVEYDYMVTGKFNDGTSSPAEALVGIINLDNPTDSTIADLTNLNPMVSGMFGRTSVGAGDGDAFVLQFLDITGKVGMVDGARVEIMERVTVETLVTNPIPEPRNAEEMLIGLGIAGLAGLTQFVRGKD